MSFYLFVTLAKSVGHADASLPAQLGSSPLGSKKENQPRINGGCFFKIPKTTKKKFTLNSKIQISQSQKTAKYHYLLQYLQDFPHLFGNTQNYSGKLMLPSNAVGNNGITMHLNDPVEW